LVSNLHFAFISILSHHENTHLKYNHFRVLQKHAQKSWIFLQTIECGRIGVDSAEVIAHFLVCPLLRKAVPTIKPYLTPKNAKPNLRIADFTVPKSAPVPEKKSSPAEMRPKRRVYLRYLTETAQSPLCWDWSNARSKQPKYPCFLVYPLLREAVPIIDQAKSNSTGSERSQISLPKMHKFYRKTHFS
jgi:hypothetical protein